MGGNYNTESGGTNAIQLTGYDKTHPCNIYDMGGNVFEWTTEKCNSQGEGYTITQRGGAWASYSWNSSASFRFR